MGEGGGGRGRGLDPPFAGFRREGISTVSDNKHVALFLATIHIIITSTPEK